MDYAIDRKSIDGGGTSTGGVFTVTGTIGQPNGSTMSIGIFSVSKGRV